MKDKTTLDLTNNPKISVIIPTQNRTHLLPAIIDCFNQQTWRNKELLILDNTPNGKEAIEQLQKQFPNILLWHIEGICSIGSKRNQLIQKASGELIAHFDDDDYYAPSYIEILAKVLIDSNSDLIKLSAWFCLHELSKTLGYWDTTREDLPHTVFSGDEKPTTYPTYPNRFNKSKYISMMIGYGFSYMFKRTIWETTKFDDIGLGEDSIFFEKIFEKKAIIKTIKDEKGICIHVIHSNNTSRCFPNFLIPNWLAPESLAKAIQGSDCQRLLHHSKQIIPKTIITTGSKAQMDNSSIQKAWAKMRKNLKGWDIQIYTDEEAEKFIKNNYDHNIYSAYQKINPEYGAAKADFFRYCAIYKLGGIYIDIKSYISNDPSLFIKETDELLLSHWDNEPGQAHAQWGKWDEINSDNGEFINWLIIAKEKHPFMQKVIETITKNIHEVGTQRPYLTGKAEVLRLTGPIAYTICLQECIEKSENSQHSLFDHKENLIYYSIFEEENDLSFIQMDKQFKGSKLHHESNHYSQKTTPILLKEAITERIATEENLRLNLGCGNKKIPGFINIDQSEQFLPDLLLNLEDTPYPFKTSSVEYIKMDSVLEHLPVNPEHFFRILREINRISKNNAIIDILCPHPFHRWQIVDFTHQKPISLEGLLMLDKEYCRELIRTGDAKTPLALIYDVDFVAKSYQQSIDPECKKHIVNLLGEFDDSKIDSYAFLFNNIIGSQSITLQVRKGEQ